LGLLSSAVKRMDSPRLGDRSAGRRRSLPSPDGDPARSVRGLLLTSWPGRLFIISSGVKIAVAASRLLGETPAVIQLLSAAATVGLIVSVSCFVWRLFALMKERLLWRVRRRLILSYIFIGVVPSLLIVIFFLLGGILIFMNVSAYLFRDGLDKMIADVNLTTDAAASEMSRAPEAGAQTLRRIHRNASKPYRVLSLVYIPVTADGGERVALGPWQHMPAPTSVPAWLTRDGFPAGTIALPSPESAGQLEVVIRAAMPVVVEDQLTGFVIGDLPIGPEMVQKLEEMTGVRAGPASALADTAGKTGTSLGTAGDAASNGSLSTLFRRSVIFLDYVDWPTRAARRVGIALSYSPNELYRRLSEAQQIEISAVPIGVWAIITLLVIAGLFLIIEIVALSMGLALARSITSAIHELFMGTERVRHGDFAHRIDVHANDQLGELAGSFNQMTGSIEGLLQTAAEKKRLEEELRIARVIQMSLLPRGPLDLPGLGVTALCVPAREVGGDYYDFFRLPDDRVGILIADVSGKGTSAALYMAELKGLVLALSQRYDSPRELLLEVNRIISEHLDSRSFITMTYAVIDAERRSMTFCRAGHTPLIYLPAPSALAPAVQVLTPSGMVVGLCIDGAPQKFAELLEEETVPLSPGDVIVLYTDGISEAMNQDNDLFGEPRLSRIVEEHGHMESGELRERILREIEAFVGSADQHDDMTMILMKVEGAVVIADRVAV
jgi:sigma-B regulation protein RsbU (phosphoserine phosphatase)